MNGTMRAQSVIILLFVLFTKNVFPQDPGDPCLTKKGTDGVCTVVDQCPEAVKELQQRRRHTLRRCGFEDLKEVVCCSPQEQVNKFGDKIVINSRKIVEDECNKIDLLPPLDTHILEGEAVARGEFPHTVALGFPKDDGSFRFDCGGTIISKTFVLTAAHCVENLEDVPPTIVRAGVVELGSNFSNPDVDVNITEIIKHPNYTRSSKYDDIALLRLEKPLKFSRYVNAACLEPNLEVGTGSLEVSGWGLISNKRSIKSHILMKTSINGVPKSNCEQYYTEMRKLPRGIIDGQFCAGDVLGGGHDSCEGDSGGPATKIDDEGRYKLVGVTSFGRGCGSTIPAIYTRVAHYLDWIVSHVWPAQ